MGCASCGGGRSRSGMGARAVLQNRALARNNRVSGRGIIVSNPSSETVVNVVPTAQGVVIPSNSMSENPATGVIPPQMLNVQPIDLEVKGENETAAEEAKGE